MQWLKFLLSFRRPSRSRLERVVALTTFSDVLRHPPRTTPFTDDDLVIHHRDASLGQAECVYEA